VPLRVAGRALGGADGDAALLRLRDPYLEPRADHGSPRVLRELCDVALGVAPLQRAVSWWRILRGGHPGWTAEHLAPGTLGAPAADLA
jgi:hypothetical protein